MRAHLDAWWEGVKNGVNEPQRIVIGSERENPTLLTACEWFDVFVDQQRQIRQADLKNGIWHLDVAASGEYEIDLRRWPAESDLPLTASLPETPVTDGVYLPGKALPIRSARLQIAGQEQSAETSDADKSVRFRVSLAEGPTTLQAWFCDAQENEICGAYYVCVRRR